MDSAISGTKDELKKIPSAATSMIFFLCITIIYGFFMIFATMSSPNLSMVVSNSNNPIFTLIYILLLIAGTYFINVSVSKNMCMENSIRWGSVMGITIMPWLIIFGILYFMLELFPGWINPFANTIGFFVVNSLGATQAVKDMLKTSADKGTTLKKALENIEKNYTRFINEIDSDQDNYTKFVDQLYRENFIAGSGSDDGQFEVFLNGSKSVNLFALINVKKIVGKLFWYLLAGTLISAISYNFIINMSCNKTLDQSTQEYDELYKNTQDPVYGRKWIRLLEEPTQGDNQDYTTQLSEFISNHSQDFLSDSETSREEVEFTKHQLNRSGMSYDELPANSYIMIMSGQNNHYFRPIA